jgi:hypothetical protein
VRRWRKDARRNTVSRSNRFDLPLDPRILGASPYTCFMQSQGLWKVPDFLYASYPCSPSEICIWLLSSSLSINVIGSEVLDAISLSGDLYISSGHRDCCTKNCIGASYQFVPRPRLKWKPDSGNNRMVFTKATQDPSLRASELCSCVTVDIYPPCFRYISSVHALHRLLP